MNDLKEKLLSRIFPKGMLDYFEIVKVIELPKGGLQIDLEEIADIPPEFEMPENYVCHGFYDWQIIHDFPLRGDIFDLNIHRRRWKNKQSLKTRSRDWNLIAEGSSLSQEFATFLKELH